MKTRIALASGLALALAASSISAIAVPNSQEKNAPKTEQAQFQLPGTMIQIKPNDLTKAELKELVRKVDKAVKEQTAKAKLNSSENDKDRAANSENSALGSNNTASNTGLRRDVPNPNPALDFKNIKEDPENYRLPKAAEAFKSGNKYQIPTPIQGGKAVGEYDKNLLKYYAQKVTWGSCEPFGYGASDGLEKKIQCAYAIVPMDYSKPNGPTIAVGMLKVLSSAGNKKLGTVFTDPGGPGGSGMDLAYGQVGDPITEKFDIIGFDPRGVGASLPQIRCESSDAKDKQRQYSDAISGEEADKILEYNTNKCYENTGKVFTGLSGKDFIGTIGTANVVRDLDVMRSIAGDPKLSYLGFSYGTSIGYRYAQLFPSHIRALILDGQVNPYENNPELLKKYEDKKILTSSTESADVSQMRGFNNTFKQFLKACLQGADCPLGDGKAISEPTKEQVQKAYDNYLKLARLAWNTGYYTSGGERAVSFADVTQGTILAMYSDSLWPHLKLALTKMKESKDASTMMLLADHYYERDKTTGKYDFSDASFRSISCTDIKDASDNRDEQLEISKDLFKTAPFLDPGKDENGKQRGLKAAYGWCHYYKVREQLPKGEEIKDIPNVLVISSSYDPATPYENGVVAAMGLHGTLLSVANNSHCAYGKVGCASAVSLAYLTDPLKFIADVNRDKYDKGQPNVQTRHIYSNKDVTGNQCQIDYYGPKLQGVENGKEVTEVNQVFNQATLKASGFLPGKEVKFVLANGTVLGTATADDKGNAELSLAKLDTLPAGKEVQILAQSSNLTSVLELKVNPRPEARGVIKDKAGVKVITRTKADTHITIEGYNFIPNEKVEFVLHSNPVALGTATADAKGNVVLKTKVPADTKLGNHQVWLVQGKTTVKLPLEVYSDILTKPGKNTNGNLSSTGTSATLWLLLSTILTGGGVLLVYRRKALA